jgi:lipoate---protein ligase
MKYLDLTLPSPAANLAGDEALLDLCEEGLEDEVLRFWESPELFVVVGYANSAAKEVNLDACKADNVSVLRRLSGGGTVLQGPGCLNYSLILRIPESGPLGNITGANNFIMEKQRAAMRSLAGDIVEIESCTDLAVGGVKFSGNAQRRKRRALIFHGTILLKFELRLIEKYLRMPSKEPDYRKGRTHGDFLTNLGQDEWSVKRAIREVWGANERLSGVPSEKVKWLCEEKYFTEEWNLKF